MNVLIFFFRNYFRFKSGVFLFLERFVENSKFRVQKDPGSILNFKFISQHIHICTRVRVGNGNESIVWRLHFQY